MHTYKIEKQGSKEYGPCSCCGNNSKTVWGFIYQNGFPHAAYLTQWTLDAVEKHGANFDLILGNWGQRSTADERRSVSLEFRIAGKQSGFMIIDSESRMRDRDDVVKKWLSRDQVMGTDLATHAFYLVDLIWQEDARISEIVKEYDKCF